MLLLLSWAVRDTLILRSLTTHIPPGRSHPSIHPSIAVQLGSKGYGDPVTFDNTYYKTLLDKPWERVSAEMAAHIGGWLPEGCRAGCGYKQNKQKEGLRMPTTAEVVAHVG